MIRFFRNSVIERSVKSNIFLLFFSNYIIELFSFLLPYEEDWTAFKNIKINKKDIILDIGAHWGESAISFSKYYDNKIFCFEPNPFIFKKLENKTKNLNVKLFKYGIGKQGSNKLFVPCFFNYHLSLWASSNLKQLKNRISKYTFLDAKKIKYKKIVCLFNQLPEIKEKVAIIKIDVEGLEYQVIKKINDIINKDKPLLFIEYNEDSFEKTFNYLIIKKYHAFIFFNNKLNKKNLKEIIENSRLSEKRTLNVIFRKY